MRGSSSSAAPRGPTEVRRAAAAAVAAYAGHMLGTLLALNVGSIAILGNGGRRIESAFEKTPVVGVLDLGRQGLPGDEHAWKHHGGPDMAVLVYAREHYSFWEDDCGLELPPSGAFGENFTTRGLVETEVCIGDVFRVGGAVVQVSQ